MLKLARISDKKWQELAAHLPPGVSPEVKDRFMKVGEGVPKIAGPGYASTLKRAGNTELWILGEGEETPRQAHLAPVPTMFLLDVSPDGKRVLVSYRTAVSEVDLASGEERLVFRLPEETWTSRATYLAGDRVALVAAKKLRLLATGESWREVLSLDLGGDCDVTPLRSRTLLMTVPTGNYGGRVAKVYCLLADSLEEVTKADFATPPFRPEVEEMDGRTFVLDRNWNRYELLGLPDAPAAATSKVHEDDYIFYGEAPGDWYEGANLGHIYEVVFREPPSAQTKARLAKVFEKGTSEGAVESAPHAWMWSGRWAMFFLGERDPERYRNGFFDGVRELMDSFHAAAPVAEVIFRGTRSDGTVYPRSPTPGPRYPKIRLPEMFGSTTDDSLPIGAPDEAFEKARVAARSAPREKKR